MIHSHAVCDFEPCGATLFVEEHGDSMDDNYILSTGWVQLKWSEGDEEDRVDETRDFCSFLCAARWCESETDSEAVVSEQQMPRLDLDE